MRMFARCTGIIIALVATLVIGACEGDGGGETQNIAGGWVFSFDSGRVVRMILEQTASGSVQGVGSDQAGNPWSFSGEVNGKHLSGTSIPEITISATIEGNSMFGTYKQGSVTGSFSGQRA